MKHLKLFNGFNPINEAFERYEFGAITNPIDATEKFYELQELYEAGEIGKFTDADVQHFNGIFRKHESIATEIAYDDTNSFVCFYKGDMYYVIYALGDYCYGFFEQNTNYEWIYCEIIDDSDRMYTILDSLLVDKEYKL